VGPRDNAGVWRPDIEAERRAHLKPEAANDQTLGDRPLGDRPQSSNAGTGRPSPKGSGGWVAGGIGAITIAAIVWMLTDFGPQSVPPNVAAIEKAAAGKSTAPAATSPPAGTSPPAATTPPAAAIAPPESLAKNEVVVTGMPSPAAAAPVAVAAPAKPAAAPRASSANPAPRARPARPSNEARIRSQVQARLEANRSISGKIGIEIEGATVRLTGYTLTPTQARLAEREARRVPGVRGVRNEIRPRVGGGR
jgi:hypothetical protein